jgi:ubiquinone/menaquinone biosynthesis C-methylase UbiE
MQNKYNEIVGYSPLDDIDINKINVTVANNKKIIEKFYKLPQNSHTEILVAGAGNGQEAISVYNLFRIKTIGIDLNVDFSLIPRGENIILEKQDLMGLNYQNNTFSIIYCNHVLEHVSDHQKVLSELARVMKRDGVLFIGFPNRHRILGYMGSSQKLSLLDIIKWNFNDYKFKLKGKFRNNYGAHAGFTQNEFIKDAEKYFSKIIPVRNDYMYLKYPKYNKILSLFEFLKIEEYVYPSNYFICLKK